MPNSVIVGAQWGDEGKAKVTDYLTERSDIITRFQGGANAGHTIKVNDFKFIFHLVPSGIVYPDKICVVGNGVVFDAEQFFVEVDELKEKGISVDGRLFVSNLTHLVLPYHKALDAASESNMGGKKIGTTGRGIGPAYADKVSRTGIRVGDMIDWNDFSAKVRENCAFKTAIIEKVYDVNVAFSADEILAKYKPIRERLLPFIADTGKLLFEAARSGKRLLFEGAQGTFLDIDHGTYPFVTSSNTVAGCASTGSGIGPKLIDHVIGIVKAYTTRVGNGPFLTELTDATGEKLRSVGSEFGSTTGRPRRCGWFDSVMLRKSIQLNSMTRMALTKLDVLSAVSEIKICTHYKINGKITDDFPATMADLSVAEPIYEIMPGWNCDITGCRKMSDLPPNALAYVKKLQQLCYDVPILLVSVGAERSQTIEVDPI